MSSKLPSLLSPFLSLPPEATLTLLTSVLGASTNWLVMRFLSGTLLQPKASERGVNENDDGGDVRVVLVSFLRDSAFWREGGKRLGLDLDKLSGKKKFVYVDGLSGLFLPGMEKARAGERLLKSSKLESVRKEIGTAIESLRGKGAKVVLVLDGLDLLLAAGGDGVDATGLEAILTDLQEEVHSTIVALASDLPLVSNSQTPLEISHAAFLLSIAHRADLVISLRLLDSGTARDVSGVLRITVGRDGKEITEDAASNLEERELLYFVGGDGGVKVFERGQ